MTGPMFISIVEAAKRSCRLGNLTELALAGGGWFDNCPECGIRPAPLIQPAELRQALRMLLPLPRLKVLRISVAPNFLDVLDLELYLRFAAQLPALEKLHLGHSEFTTSSLFHETTYYERVPLHHLATFCHLFSNLKEICVGTVDAQLLEDVPQKQWICPQIKKSRWKWAGRAIDRDRLHNCVRAYFPGSDMASIDLNERLYIFSS